MSTPANDLNIRTGGYVVFDGVSVFTGRTFQAGTGITLLNASGIAGNTTISINNSLVGQTITGDTGGALSPTSGNWNILSTATAGASTSFSGSGSTLSFNTTDAFVNTFIGSNSGNTLVSTPNARNTAVGAFSLQDLTIGTNNNAFGYFALNNCTSGTGNVAIGNGALNNGLTFTDNTAVGASAGQVLSSSAIQNTLIGSGATCSSTGTNNICLGYRAGTGHATSESSCILIGNIGLSAESNSIRIGTQGSGAGQQNKCFIAGIASVTTSNSQMVTINTATGQLGSISFPVLQVSGTLTNAQIKALNASPVTVLAAPGSGRFYRILAATGKFIYGGSNVFVAGAGQTIAVYLSTAINPGISLIPNAQLTGTTTVYTVINGGASTIATGAENQPMILYNSNVTEISGNAANDNTIAYNIVYQIINI